MGDEVDGGVHFFEFDAGVCGRVLDFEMPEDIESVCVGSA